MPKRGTPRKLKQLVEAERMLKEFAIPEIALEPYCFQVYACRNRGIEMKLTIKEWWDWWQVDDRWTRRGKGAGKLVMCRIGDKGDYTLDNICVGKVGKDEPPINAKPKPIRAFTMDHLPEELAKTPRSRSRVTIIRKNLRKRSVKGHNDGAE